MRNYSLIDLYPITKKEAECRDSYLNSIYIILSGSDTRKMIIVGPCSADREDAVIEYTIRLSKLQYENIQELYDLSYKANLKKLAVIVDCNHCNSNKNYDEQGSISKEVFSYCEKK